MRGINIIYCTLTTRLLTFLNIGDNFFKFLNSNFKIKIEWLTSCKNVLLLTSAQLDHFFWGEAFMYSGKGENKGIFCINFEGPRCEGGAQYIYF